MLAAISLAHSVVNPNRIGNGNSGTRIAAMVLGPREGGRPQVGGGVYLIPPIPNHHRFYECQAN